ncbi:MAG: hypothetical protein IJU19_04180 [Bacteroidales bacterium]|nr:hypothetical protein [Bacteroidales bacterium]
MKYITNLCLIMLLAATAWGQRPNDAEKQHKHKNISELVSNLSASQKQEIEAIGKATSARVAALRKQQQSVRDSIHLFMDTDGDHSADLYPLFDREASLQVAINREMYAGKVKIDSLLTAEQRAELRKASADNKHRRPRR